MGSSTPDTSFSIGFSLDTNTKGISATEWLRIDVAQRQIEVGNGLNVTVVEHVPGCDECAYAYYVQDNSLGRVSYFTGVVVRNGFLAGVYSQLVQRDARLFADECAVLLKGIEVEAP